MNRINVSFLVLAAVIAGCGSGGGGGNSADGGSPTGVRVLHAAIDAVPVDVSALGTTQPVSEGNRFGVANYYHEVPAGSQVITLLRAKSSDRVVASLPATVTSESKLSVLLYGDSSTGLQTRLLDDQFSTPFQGSLIRVVHGAKGAAAVRVVATASAGGSVSGGASFGGPTEYLNLAAGVVTITSTRAADNRAINSVTVPLEEGRAYTLLLAGEIGYYVKGVLYSDN